MCIQNASSDLLDKRKDFFESRERSFGRLDESYELVNLDTKRTRDEDETQVRF